MVITFVQTAKDMQYMSDHIKEHDIFVLPVFEYAYHPNNNKVSFFAIMTIKEMFIISNTHPDCLQAPFIGVTLKSKRVYTPSRTMLKQAGLIFFESPIEDLNALVSLEHGMIPNSTITTSKSSINAESLMVLVDKCIHVYDEYRNYMNSALTSEYYHLIKNIDALALIENSGLTVNTSLLDTFFDGDTFPRMYSRYNPFTTTGRPSNSFGGLNFAALNKSNGIRKAFIPRNDMLLSVDFESFHLRIIAKLIGYKFGDEPVHRQFAKIYFQTDSPTQEQYDESKQITFSYMYGEKSNPPHEFFSHLYKLKDFIWKQMNEVGYIQFGDRKLKFKDIHDPNKEKTLNYVIQMVESELGFEFIRKISHLFSDDFKCILYTYDSFLFDIKITEENRRKITELNDLLRSNGDFPIRFYIGKNYQEMNLINM